MKKLIRLFLLVLIGLSFSSCKQEQTNEEKFEEAKYNVYEKFIGEYTADGYSDFSGDYVPFLGSKYEGMESIIFKKNSLIFNKKEYSLRLLCPCELQENHQLFKQKNYKYVSENKDLYYEYDGKKFNSFEEMNLDFGQTYIINRVDLRERYVDYCYGYFLPYHHTQCETEDVNEVIIPIEENNYIYLYYNTSFSNTNDSIRKVRFCFSLGVKEFETYLYKSIDVCEVNRDPDVNNGNWYEWDFVDFYEEIDESSRKIEQYLTSNYCEFYRVEKEDDNNIENPDDDSSNDDENELGTENDTTLDFSVEGDWLYSIQGFQPTTLTLYNDQTFEFNKNNDITSGTYSLSGNKITFDYEKGGQEITDTFTVTGSVNEITLDLVKSITTVAGSTQESTTMSYMLLGFYTTTDISITLTK